MRLLAVRKNRLKIWNVDETELFSCQWYSGIDSKGYFRFWKAPKNFGYIGTKEYIRLTGGGEIQDSINRTLWIRNFIPAHWDFKAKK